MPSGQYEKVFSYFHLSIEIKITGVKDIPAWDIEVLL
jgi:hypothetical protein